jgi:acetyltransferase
MTYVACPLLAGAADARPWAYRSSVVIRRATAEDAAAQCAFFRGLSARARYFRFMSAVSEVPAAFAHSLSNMEYNRHFPLLAKTLAAGTTRIIGEARYIVDGSDPGSSEFSLSVAEDWQGIGLGRALLWQL